MLAKHGKLELSVEEEEIIKLYMQKYEHLLHQLCPLENYPLAKIVGIGYSNEKRSVIKDLERLEAGGPRPCFLLPV